MALISSAAEAIPLMKLSSAWRSIISYALVIVLPSLVLLGLALLSVQRERDAVRAVHTSNMVFERENLAGALEGRSEYLAQLAMRDHALAAIPHLINPGLNNSGDWQLPARQVRAALESTKKRHRIVDQVFVLSAGRLVYPVLSGGASTAGDSEFYLELGDAEALEFGDRNLEAAIVRYLHCLRVAKKDSERALAVARTARCLRKMSRSPEAKTRYGQLLNIYGDQYDPFGRPYALVASLELAEPVGIRLAHERLVRGDWEVDGETLDYFLGQFNDTEAESPYVRQFRVATLAEPALRQHAPGSIQPGGFALTLGGEPHQVFTLPVADGVSLAVVADLKFIAGDLLATCSKEGGFAEPMKMTLRGRNASALFKGAFEPWDLVPADAGPSPGLWSAKWGFLGLSFCVVAVLVMGVILVLRDVSRQASVNRLQSSLVGGVAHELATPLTVIQMYVEMLNEPDTFSESQRRSFLQIISGETWRLSVSMKRAVSFSLVDRDHDRYRLKRTDIVAVVAKTTELQAPYWALKGFAFNVDLPTDPIWVNMDDEAFSLAMLNLVDNAAKYSGDSRWVGIRVCVRDGQAVIEVEDRGLGIASDERQRIFGRSYRGRAAPEKGGYGFGLFLVRRVMDAHTGRVEVDSELGLGSCFRLVFPCIKS